MATEGTCVSYRLPAQMCTHSLKGAPDKRRKEGRISQFPSMCRFDAQTMVTQRWCHLKQLPILLDVARANQKGNTSTGCHTGCKGSPGKKEKCHLAKKTSRITKVGLVYINSTQHVWAIKGASYQSFYGQSWHGCCLASKSEGCSTS